MIFKVLVHYVVQDVGSQSAHRRRRKPNVSSFTHEDCIGVIENEHMLMIFFTQERKSLYAGM